MMAAANDRGNILNAESEIGIWPLDMNLIRTLHPLLQRVHSWLQFCIVQRAYFKIKVFERLRTHPGQLCHCRSGPTQDDPLCFVDALIKNGLHQVRRKLHFFRSDVREFGDIVRTSERYISIHGAHPRELEFGYNLELLFLRFAEQLTSDNVCLQIYEWIGTLCTRSP